MPGIVSPIGTKQDVGPERHSRSLPVRVERSRDTPKACAIDGCLDFARHERKKEDGFIRYQPSAAFTQPLALLMSSWLPCRSFTAAMTLPMSLTLVAPSSATIAAI